MQELSLWEYFVKCLSSHYASFSGRARRKEYWGFTLFSILVSWVIGALDGALFETFSGNFGYLSAIFSFGTIIPSFAVGVRRLHDVGKSGWMLLLYLLPIIGWIWLLVLFVTDSHQGANEYGANPKGEGDSNEIDQIGVE